MMASNTFKNEDCTNILLLGDEDAKHRFLNSLANYVEYRNIEGLSKWGLKCLIPQNITYMAGNSVICLDMKQSNGSYSSPGATYGDVASYIVYGRNNKKCCLIDLQGASKESGIETLFAQYTYLHSILIVLEKDISQAVKHIDFIKRNFSHVGNSVLENISYIFTHLEKYDQNVLDLQKELISRNVPIVSGCQNVYCMDANMFSDLAKNIPMTRDKSDIWKWCRINCLELLSYIQKLQPCTIRKVLLSLDTVLETQEQPVSKIAQTKKDVNILILGESGSGKSTFINSLANYLKYETLQEAMNSKPECLISTSFTMANENYEDQVVSIDHHSSSLCSPGDIFDDICEYKYHMEEATIRVIETPAVLEEINGEWIVSVLSNYSHLNAIVFLLKSNGNIASEYFKLSIRHLLTIVDETALGNIIFVLTHSRSTFYKPGETMTHLKTLIKSMGVEIPCDKSNIFCVDNESFGYLVASHQGMNVTSNEMKTFSKSWKRSRENCLDLLEYVASMKEQTIGKRLTDKYTPQMLDELGPLLCNLSMALGLNLQILDGHRKSKVASKIELFTIVKATADNREATICKSLRCRTIKVNNSSYVSDKQICHKPCCCTSKLEANNKLECEVFPRNGCIKCYCPPRFHKRVKSLRVLKDSSPSSNSNCEEDLVKAISVVEYEYDLVTDALALLHLHAGMSKNYIFETLEFEQNRDYMSNMPVYSCLKKMFEQKMINLQKTNTNSLQSTIDSLYKSKSIRQVLIQIFGEIEETRSPMKEENCAPVRETASNDEFTFDKLTSSFDNLLLNVQTKCESPRQLEMLEKWHRVFAERTEQLKARLDEAKAHMTLNQVDEPDCSNLDITRSTGSHSGGSETSILPKKEKNLLHLSRRKIRAIRAKKQKDLPYMSNEQNDEKPLVLKIL